MIDLQRSRSGFILIIVVGLLGVLAYLALSLAEKSKLARTLSTAYLLESQTKLAARSGIEKGRQLIFQPFLNGGVSSQAEPLPGSWVPVILPVDGQLSAGVHLEDPSGRICLNDGMKAGQAELGSLYNPQALDPWPDLPLPRQQDVSAWINMRLRSLLNAYGDVQRFAAAQLPHTPATNGWPEWQNPGTAPAYSNNGPTYNNAVVFNHTATETADRFTSIPPCLLDGTVTTPAGSAGLGDRIIGARPAKGYTDVEQIHTILDQWWSDHKPVGYAETDFFARVSSDFSIDAWHDKAFWRMKREFGGNHAVYTGQADYQNDPTNSSHGAMLDIEATPPDFTDIWKPHPVPPINLNAASDAVRASVFHAPVNISLVYESIVYDTADWGPPFNYQMKVNSTRPTLGVGAPMYPGLNENGKQLSAAGNTLLTQWQKNRMLSVRDSMIASQAYLGIVQVEGYPDSFERFAWHLRRFLMAGGHQVKFFERADRGSATQWSTYGKDSSIAWIDNLVFPNSPGEGMNQWGPMEFFPHILSCQRRLPGWMGAPLALLSPWRRHNNQKTVLRSVEDFVFRSPLPKVIFQPTGAFFLRSSAHLQRGPMTCRRHISAVVQAYETTVLRDQASFQSITDNALGATSPDIQIGPELGGTPSPYLGTVGLKDRGDVIPGVSSWAARYDFTAGFKADPSSSIGRALPTPAFDPDVVTGNGVAPGFGHEELMGSGMEGSTLSIFPRAGQEACDLSPFGGAYFSSFNHGIHSAKPFGDSFYFRPSNFLIDPNGYLGTRANKGLISVWVRRPTGYLDSASLMHMTLWERVMCTLGPSYPGPVESRLRPHYFHLYMDGTWPKFAVGTGHCGLSFNGPGAIPDGGYGFETWPQLQPMPLPVSANDFSNNPLFNYRMPSWIPNWNTGLPNMEWSMGMTTTGVAQAQETGSMDSKLRIVSPYLARRGGWMRLVARWDFSKFASPQYKTEIVGHFPPSLPGITHSTGNGHGHGLMNPKMVMSFGERQYQVRPASATTITAPIGTLLPVNRLNSCLDNIVVQFGGLPNVNFETDPTTSSTETRMWDAIQAIPGFDNRRYNIRPAGAQPLSEPAWVINPKLPAGSKILQFGARIYDVPFYPEFSAVGGWTSTWPVLAPRVDLSMAQGATAVTPLRSALRIIDQNVEIHSNPWLSYPMLPSASGTRFKLTYRSVDAMNQPLTQDMLTDIPWIQEVNWAWIPPSGMRILSWKEE